MKVVGLFRELDSQVSQTIQSIHDAVGMLPADNIAAIVTYLQSGEPVFDVMGVSVDPFDSSVWISGGPSLMSDGVWIWRNDLAYLVEKYKVGLPDEFVSHALQHRIVSVEENFVVNKCEEIVRDYYLAEQGIHSN